MFCVTRPRLDVRFLNSPVDSSGSFPARSRARMWRKNQIRKAAPTASNTAISTPSLSACRIPNTTKNMPTADRIAPTASKGRVGSGAMGSTIRRLSRTIVATTTAWKTNAARQLIAGGDETADQRSRRGADAAQPADDAEGPGTRREVAEPQRREDVDGRDQQRRADALEHRVAEDQHAEPGETALSSAPIPYSTRPAVKQRLRPQRSVSLLHGDHEDRHDQQEQRDRRLHARPRSCRGPR